MNRLKNAVRASAKSPATRIASGAYVKTYCFEPDFVGFSGHFPGYPILPAVIQIFTGLITAEEIKGCPLQLIAITKAKFHIEIRPGYEVHVECCEGITQGMKSFEFTLTIPEGVAATLLMIVTKKE
jgi:3-hydroxyacyl-[acyl-carrier-protein] dehydratase